MIYFLAIFIFRAPSFSPPHLPCLVSACLLVCSVLIFDLSSLCFIGRLTPVLGWGRGAEQVGDHRPSVQWASSPPQASLEAEGRAGGAVQLLVLNLPKLVACSIDAVRGAETALPGPV